MFNKKPMLSAKDLMLLYETSWNNAFSKTGRVPKVIITSSELRDELARECEARGQSMINGTQGYCTQLMWREVQVVSIEDVMCVFGEI